MDCRFTQLAERLAQRRTELGISHSALAHHSGVAEPTVKRILGGAIEGAAFSNVIAIADALGISVSLDETGVDDVRVRQARAKAERIARMVQGTSALEGQGVDDEQYQRLVERTFHELLAGSDRRLWAA